MTPGRGYCTFRVGGLHLGVEVLRVREALRCQPLTRIPLAAGAVSGLINLRGEIVTAVDARVRLGLPPRPAGQEAMNVVVQTADEPVSLLVDAIGDVIEVDDDTFEQPPASLHGVAGELVRGAFKLDRGLLLVLDIDRTVDMAPTPV